MDGLLRVTLYSLPPSVVVFYEHLIGAILLLPFIGRWAPDLKKMTRKEWIAISIVCLFSGALGTILYTAALGKVQYIQFSVVVLLQQLQPIWAIAAAAILLKERVSMRFLAWAGVALIAAYMITFRDLTVNLSTGSGTAIAGLMGLSAGILWGSSTAISKYVLNKVHFLTATALRFFLAPIFAFLFIAALGQTSALTVITQTQWATLLTITLTTGLVALAIYYYGLKRTPAKVTTLYELVWPASAIVIDYVYFHRPLTITQIAGVGLLALALWHVTSGINTKARE